MGISEVYGLERFSEYMEGFEDCYAIIGGTACDIILSDADLDFRATKDIDVILLVESRLPEAAAAVWRLVRDGCYDACTGCKVGQALPPMRSAFPLQRLTEREAIVKPGR